MRQGSKSSDILMKSTIQRITWVIIAGIGIGWACVNPAWGQGNDHLTPIQQRIQAQQRRLSSSSVEERRDALMKLGAMNHPDASRAAISALNDSDPVVRVTAAHAMAALPPSDASAALIPLLTDKQEFIRREAANALGATGSRSAVQPLIQLLTTDKEPSVRAAAAIALGKIKDDAAVVPLANVLTGSTSARKSKARENEFVVRSAAQALGEIRSRAGVSALIATLSDEKSELEVRRTAAAALGAIGDVTAVPALKTAADSNDPYLAQAARTALRRLR
jgi:HEAT repeat protein